jgi:formamidopyrimidine-DNA glycosylase
MIEIPESVTLAAQLKDTVGGKKIKRVIAAQSPHKFAWYTGDPQAYPALLTGKTIQDAYGFGSNVEFKAGDAYVAVSEGASWRYYEDLQDLPKKHQLLLEFADATALCLTVRMYGGILCFKQGGVDNDYYLIAKEKPSPLSDEFDWDYFEELLSPPEMEKQSAKAFLATEQRIPGLGNGTLQDILFNARVHPKRKVGTLSAAEKRAVFDSVKATLAQMTARGGRDTEKDLFGRPGGYATKCSKHTVGQPCAVCGTPIVKQSYMGGSVYFCPTCQPLE